MKKIIGSILVILFILCIPNCSKAATFAYDNTIAGIHHAMTDQGEAWLTTQPNFSVWTNKQPMDHPYLIQQGVFGGSFNWAIGGSCCGDPGAPGGEGQRSIQLIEMNENTVGNVELNYLAYAILFSHTNREYTTQATPTAHKGKWSITNWLVDHNYGNQIKTYNQVYPNDPPFNYHELGIRYGIPVQIGGKVYRNATEYVNDTKVRRLNINETKMKNNEERGTALKLVEKRYRKNNDIENCTLIGPYSLEISGGIDQAIMEIARSSNQRIEKQAFGYYVGNIENVNDAQEIINVKKLSELQNCSDDKKFYFVFNGHMKSGLKSIHEIKL